MSVDPHDPYVVLGVDRTATQDEIRVAYRAAAKKAHPDRKGGSHERMQALNAAYEILSDPERRERFDRTGDRTKPESIETKAETLLRQLAALIIRSPALPDSRIIAPLRGMVEAHLEALHTQRRKTREQIVDLEVKLASFFGPPGNVIAGLIEHEIGRGRESLVQMEVDEAVIRKALEMLVLYADRAQYIAVTTYTISGLRLLGGT